MVSFGALDLGPPPLLLVPFSFSLFAALASFSHFTTFAVSSFSEFATFVAASFSRFACFATAASFSLFATVRTDTLPAIAVLATLFLATTTLLDVRTNHFLWFHFLDGGHGRNGCTCRMCRRRWRNGV